MLTNDLLIRQDDIFSYVDRVENCMMEINNSAEDVVLSLLYAHGYDDFNEVVVNMDTYEVEIRRADDYVIFNCIDGMIIRSSSIDLTNIRPAQVRTDFLTDLGELIADTSLLKEIEATVLQFAGDYEPVVQDYHFSLDKINSL